MNNKINLDTWVISDTHFGHANIQPTRDQTKGEVMTQTYGEMRTELEKEVDTQILERVKRGIDFLERTVGPDWVDRVDPSRLALSSASHCVLGQIFGVEAKANDPDDWGLDGYDYAIEKYRELGDEGTEYGFCTKGNSDEEWHVLQEAWLGMLTPQVKES